MAHRLLDFAYDETHEVVHRIAAQIHRSVDANFPDVQSHSPRFSKTVFDSSEKTEQNSLKADLLENLGNNKQAPTKPRVQKLNTAMPEAKAENINSDLRGLTPATAHGPGEFSKVDTLTNLNKPEFSFAKKILLILFLVSLLSAGIAYFVHKFLIV